jgi:hypothetical protein
MKLLIVSVILLSGCNSQTLAPTDAAEARDAAPPPDLAVSQDFALSHSIGDPCRSNADCTEGKSPACWIRSLYNHAGYLAVKGGYCSSKCMDDTDCGATGVCIDEGTDGKFCFAPCSVPSDCRPNYACFVRQTGHCYPSTGLECDPTMGDGTCSDGRACIRYALGTGNTGYCKDVCDLGPASCPPSNGLMRQCVAIDTRGDVDYQGKLEGDRYYGPICRFSSSNNATGAECVFQGQDYIDACIDGDECYLGSRGDHRCHVLCRPSVADGGATGPTCPTGTRCADAFGFFSTPKPIGLCL